MGKSTGRPAGGYKNKAGEKIPGTTTILNRFKESGGLIQWAFNCGRSGLDMTSARDRAADAGTLAHEMIDAYVHNRNLDTAAFDKTIVANAEHAFLGFLEWQKQSNLKVVAAEVSLVSEVYQYGGTFDAMLVADTLRLMDYKTSSGVYTEMLVQVAGAYSLLWQEHYPDKPLHGVDILRISKPDAPDDPVSFHHHHWSAEVLPLAQRQFILLREAFDLDKRLKGML